MSDFYDLQNRRVLAGFVNTCLVARIKKMLRFYKNAPMVKRRFYKPEVTVFRIVFCFFPIIVMWIVQGHDDTPMRYGDCQKVSTPNSIPLISSLFFLKTSIFEGGENRALIYHYKLTMKKQSPPL